MAQDKKTKQGPSKPKNDEKKHLFVHMGNLKLFVCSRCQSDNISVCQQQILPADQPISTLCSCDGSYIPFFLLSFFFFAHVCES